MVKRSIVRVSSRECPCLLSVGAKLVVNRSIVRVSSRECPCLLSVVIASRSSVNDDISSTGGVSNGEPHIPQHLLTMFTGALSLSLVSVSSLSLPFLSVSPYIYIYVSVCLSVSRLSLSLSSSPSLSRLSVSSLFPSPFSYFCFHSTFSCSHPFLHTRPLS